MILSNQDTITEDNYIFGCDIIDKKTKYSLKILSKLRSFCDSGNFSNIPELFFMITYLQTKYLYDIEINLKKKKQKSLLDHKQSCTKLTHILNEFKKFHSSENSESCEKMYSIYLNWLKEQREIDKILVVFFK